jgi:hypothetical protein
MQCENEFLKRMDKIIAAIHHAAKVKAVHVAPDRCCVPDRLSRAGSRSNSNVAPDRAVSQF